MKIKLMIMTIPALILSCLLSCSDSSKISDSNEPNELVLSDKELFRLLELLDTAEHPDLNFHVLYSEQFNDSTGTIDVSLNKDFPPEGLGLCNILKFKASDVFIYGRECKIAIPKAFKSERKQAPFFIPDSPSWRILIKRRNGEMQFFRISVFTYYDDNLEDSFQDLHPENR